MTQWLVVALSVIVTGGVLAIVVRGNRKHKVPAPIIRYDKDHHFI